MASITVTTFAQLFKDLGEALERFGRAVGDVATTSTNITPVVRFEPKAAAEPKPRVIKGNVDEKPAGSSSPNALTGAPKPDYTKVRAWGRANGFTVPDRGRIPKAVLEGYLAAEAKSA